MTIYEELLSETEIPRMLKVRYNYLSDKIIDTKIAVVDALKRKNTLDRIKAGDSVAIAVGSREISNFVQIICTLVNEIKVKGAEPFIVPAMGSHGGATAEGQKEMLEGLGITEENVGAPIKSSMETVEVGKTEQRLPVHIDRFAYEADCIIPVGRIKPHTDFRGKYESGLLKMIVIGLGKQKGARICHQRGFDKMSQDISDMAEVSLENSKIIFGLGIIENAFHETYKVTAVPSECIADEEPGLLLESKKLIPVIPFKKVDVLIVEEMGKDIGGTGMDSNVIGRSSTLGIWEPFIERIAVLDLTDKSHGNANGIGLADVTTQRLFDKMVFEQTYPNTITASEPKAVKIPVVMPSDELAIKCAIKICIESGEKGVRLVRIKNTLCMNEFFISEALAEEVKENNFIEILSEPIHLNFSKDGELKI